MHSAADQEQQNALAGKTEPLPLSDEVVERFMGDPRVTGGTGFGASPGRRVDGRIFAMLVRGKLVVKLPRQRVDALVAAGTAHWFDAGKGRPMREWASIGCGYAEAWPELVAEAYAFVGSGGVKRKA